MFVGVTVGVLTEELSASPVLAVTLRLSSVSASTPNPDALNPKLGVVALSTTKMMVSVVLWSKNPSMTAAWLAGLPMRLPLVSSRVTFWPAISPPRLEQVPPQAPHAPPSSKSVGPIGPLAGSQGIPAAHAPPPQVAAADVTTAPAGLGNTMAKTPEDVVPPRRRLIVVVAAAGTNVTPEPPDVVIWVSVRPDAPVNVTCCAPSGSVSKPLPPLAAGSKVNDPAVVVVMSVRLMLLSTPLGRVMPLEASETEVKTASPFGVGVGLMSAELKVSFNEFAVPLVIIKLVT